MRIDSSNVGMESARSYSSAAKVTVALSSMVIPFNGNDTQKFKNFVTGEEKNQNSQDSEMKDANAFMFQSFSKYTSLSVRSSQAVRTVSEQIDSIKMSCFEYLWLLLFDRESLKNRSFLGGDASGGFSTMSDINTGGSLIVRNGETKSAFSEQEVTSYSTAGKVVTADGREISFGLNLEMSRSFEATYEEKFGSVELNLCDPLVINLDGNIPSLEDQTFLFDIDNDGVKDEINQLGSGSGYLALDKNGDGIINDGSELFGTSSGDGFKDLAEYDTDGDGWIDEDDEIWEKLVIWTKDENGKDTLYHLKDKGVGAICLQNASTEFSLKDDMTNATKGVIRKTGVFLYENGSAGTVQHMDVNKYSKEA